MTKQLEMLSRSAHKRVQSALNVTLDPVQDKTNDSGSGGDFFGRFVKSKPADADMQSWLRKVLDKHVVNRLLHLYTVALTVGWRIMDRWAFLDTLLPFHHIM